VPGCLPLQSGGETALKVYE